MVNSNDGSTAPKYMSQFQCVGGACEETCCADFLVDIDQGTFETYRAVKDGPLGQKLSAFVQPRGADRSPQAHARITLTPSGECPFLDGQRLCSIQSGLGESALSQTCREFPRARWERNGRPHLGGKASCPEAARLVVSSADAMDLPGDSASDQVGAFGQAVHAAVEAAARERSTPVWKAILLAGVLADMFLPDDVAAASIDASRSVQAHADQTWAQISQAKFSTGDQGLLQMRLLIEIILSASAKCNAKRNRFPHIAQTAMGAIFDGADDFDGAANTYRRLYLENFKAYDDAHDHALRNYVLNYLFTNQTFVSGPAFAQFQNLAVRYGIMRLLLVGLAGVRAEGLSIADYAAVVSSASRILDHDATVSPDICRALDAIEPRSMSVAARMVIPPA